MQNLSSNGLQGYLVTDREVLTALMLPESGARMHSLVGPAKTTAHVFVVPGGSSLSKSVREFARTDHDFISVTIRGDVYWGKQAPACSEFNAASVKWAARNSRQIAIWSAPYPDHRDDVATWMLDAVNAGSSFQTTIETTPSRAAEWGAIVKRWQSPSTEVRFFGPRSVS